MESLRDLMPALSNKIYFNYGGQGPLPTPSLKAIIRSWEKIQNLGPFSNLIWPYLNQEVTRLKEEMALICGVSKDRISLTENVTSGCILPLLGLPFDAGEHLLISDCEHPGIVAACQELAQRKNLHIDILPVRQLSNASDLLEQNNNLLKLLDEHLHGRTRLVVLSHVLWNTGQLMPIPKVSEFLFSHPNKPFLLVDAAQSFGQLPVEKAASNSDIFAFTGHKWACGPEGLGGVALSYRVLNLSSPTLIGWRSLKNEKISFHPTFENYHEDSRRFEIATSCTPLLSGLHCSLNLLEKEGSVEQRFVDICKKSTLLWDELNILKGVKPILQTPPKSGLVSFQLNQQKSTKEIVKLLGSKNIWIRDLDSPKCLRACVHITTKLDEITKLIQTISDLINS